jgi:predicted nucleic acid-binding protein
VAVESLPKLPAGIDIFLDANVFIYAFGGQSKQCLELLFRCAREEVYGVTTIEAINEVTHRLMLAEVQRSMARPRQTVPGFWEFLKDRNEQQDLIFFFVKKKEHT